MKVKYKHCSFSLRAESKKQKKGGRNIWGKIRDAYHDYMVHNNENNPCFLFLGRRTFHHLMVDAEVRDYLRACQFIEGRLDKFMGMKVVIVKPDNFLVIGGKNYETANIAT